MRVVSIVWVWLPYPIMNWAWPPKGAAVFKLEKIVRDRPVLHIDERKQCLKEGSSEPLQTG